MKPRFAIHLVVIITLLLSTTGLSAAWHPAQASPAGLSAEPRQAQTIPDAEALAIPDPVLTFDGLNRTTANFGPDAENVVPDVSGDVGHTRYIQAANKGIAIFTKGGTLIASDQLDDFWFFAPAATGAPCDGVTIGSHRGQATVLYDHMARRWFVIDVAFLDLDNGPYFLCIAVSRDDTPDNLGIGEWNFFALPSEAPHYLPELPTFGLWPNGIYGSANLFDISNNGLNRTPKGVQVWALNRESLVNGTCPPIATPCVQTFRLSEAQGYSGLVPSNLRGAPPPATTPNFFGAIAPPNKLHIWKFTVDWITGVATFGVGASHLPDSTLFMDNSFSLAVGFVVPQPGTTGKLDIRGDRLMRPLQYREINGVGALWANHTVINGATSGIRWYEIRNLLTAPSFYQQGLYQPADGNYRWLGSMAVDGEGNMALGFSVSRSGLFPSIRYTGRLASDPLNTLPQGEATLFAGTGIQDFDFGIVPNSNNEPWGRYSTMTIDPVDECSFWYTNEYYLAGAPTIWRTRIGRFSFSSCAQGTIARVSLHTNNTQGNGSSGVDFEAYGVAISSNGRYVAFASEAANLVDGDTNGFRDVFVRDRDRDGDGIFDEPNQVATVRVSVSTGGAQANGHSWEVAISSTGRYVAFSSEASNLVTGDTNGARDVFRHDRDADADGIFDEPGVINTVRVSVSSTGTQGDGRSDQPSISSNGRFVAFRSFATTLVSGDSNLVSDIFVRDVALNLTTRVSVSTGGTQADGHSYSPSISGDGTRVAFASEAANLDLILADTNTCRTYVVPGSCPDIFVHNRSTGITQRISKDSAGTQSDEESYAPSFSGNGLFVVFVSRATNLVVGDVNGVADIFIRDLLLNTTSLVSGFIGAQTNADSYTPSVTDDGRFVVFASDADNLSLIPDINGQRDIFLHDLATGSIQLISNAFDGAQANAWSVAPVISGADGRHVAFASEATNLVSDDTNNVWDVFARDRQGTVPIFLTIPANIPGVPGGLASVPVNFTNNGQGIDTTTFSVDFDQNCLTFDPVDGSDADSFPDAITFSLPAGFNRSVSYSAADADGELDFAIWPATIPPPTLPTSTLATIQFTVKATCQAAPATTRSARVGFSGDPPASFATNGRSVRGRTADGSVEILAGLLGDCNGDTLRDAGDITALVLEIFDGDGSAPADTPRGTFPGSPVGCNPNRDVVVDAGDISCTILLIFGGACSASAPTAPSGALASSGALADPVVSMPDQMPTAPGGGVAVPVHFSPNGYAISSLVFSVDYDPARLTFDPTDGDGDQIPDAVRLNVPPGFGASVNFDPSDSDGELDVVILDAAAPITALPDGDLLSITFQAATTTAVAETVVAFAHDPVVSFGDTAGQSIPGQSDDGSVLFNPRQLFLPVIVR